ncbi:VOC family protein [Streptosporangium sandarakinum]|uniref:VOC family protein n=1 Tax=Streptosporangium sandarakinum TaxID=1260955 RepID=UPI00342F0E58
MEVLSSRILIRPSDPEGSRRFYRDVLGLAVYREFGPPSDPGVVFFLGQGFLEVSGHSGGTGGGAAGRAYGEADGRSDGGGGGNADDGASGRTDRGAVRQAGGGPPDRPVGIWLQVRDVRAEHERLTARGVRVLREPRQEPWGLVEMWIEDPDGTPLVLVEIPADHPLRRDQRPL